jgi:hypothetical protein
MGKAYIKNGTPVGTDSLCKTCSRALVITGYRESEQITMCDFVDPNIVLPFTVYTCSGFYDKNRPTWEQMEELAIDVTPAPFKPVGFKVGVGFHEAATVKTRVSVELDEDEEDED